MTGPRLLATRYDSCGWCSVRQVWAKLVAEPPTVGEHQAKTTRQILVFMLTRQD